VFLGDNRRDDLTENLSGVVGCAGQQWNENVNAAGA
jgi:hypothetical protein